MLGTKNKEIPTEKVLDMQKQGMRGQEIISNLQSMGYKHEQIASAMDQAAVKREISEMDTSSNNDVPLALMNAPSPSDYSTSQQQEDYSQFEYSPPESQNFAPEPLERSSYDTMEEIAESIIKEKWTEMMRGMGDLTSWKNKVDLDVEGVKQELIRTQQKFDDLQKALAGKISEYSDGMISLGTDMKALEKVLEKIILPLTKSVKDLQEVSERLSARRASTTRKKKH